MSPSAPTRRLELTLRKPWIGWWPKPTVVFGGRGQPAQWGTGTWQVAADEPTVVGVYLFNQLWRFGEAEIVLHPEDTAVLRYAPPPLPFLRGHLRRA